MTTRIVASVGKFFDHHFPERQIYHRSRGSVQFMTLSAQAQIGLLIMTLAFFGWVAYASVNVVFKDQIIAAKEQHFSTMQAAYEGRLAEMQAAYDELNGALVLTQDRFSTATSDLETKHRQLSEILNRQDEALRNLGDLRTRVASAHHATDVEENGNKLTMSVAELEPTMRHSRGLERQRASPFDIFTRGDSTEWRADVTAGMPRPFAEETRRIELRLTTLNAAQRNMIAELEGKAERTVRELESVIEVTGLNVERVLERGDSTVEGVGGPFVPLDAIEGRGDGKDGDEFTTLIAQFAGYVDRLKSLETALGSFPLVAPLQVNSRLTSRFGRRYDPFTKRPAFHYGLDFSAPFKSTVYATAPGRVIFAGRSGPYGNLIEIDHGNGLRTRYGHLHKINVKAGQEIGFQEPIGLLGSTGRSTGPHLHYEVRFNGTLRDPARFLEAGRYVFEE